MGFYSGVYSGICKIGLKSYKTSLCCHPNSSAASGTYTQYACLSLKMWILCSLVVTSKKKLTWGPPVSHFY